MSNIPRRARHAKAPTSRGVHHLALNTEDMKATVDFYTGLLGMPLIHALRVPAGLGTGAGNRGNPPFENLRHYFFDAGGDSMVAFFEMPKSACPQGDRNAIGTMQHCSFTVTEGRSKELRARLEAAGVAYLGPIAIGCDTQSIYVRDPSDIRLEFSWQPLDCNDTHVVEGWTQTQEEAISELRDLCASQEWLQSVTAHLPKTRA